MNSHRIGEPDSLTNIHSYIKFLLLVVCLVFAYDADAQGNDTDAPTVQISIPASNNDLLFGGAGAVMGTVSVTLTGTATDEAGGSGIASVEVRFRSLDQSLWYNPVSEEFISVWGGPEVPVTLSQQGASDTWDWSTTVDLPPGDYRVFFKAVDIAGNVAPTFERLRFMALLTGTILDAQPPLLSIDVPMSNGDFLFGPAGAVADTVSVSLQGVVSDEAGGSGVDSVQLQLRSLDFAQWYNPASEEYLNSWGGPEIPVTLNLQGPSDTFYWSATVDVPEGNYRVFATARDLAGNIIPESERVRFTAALTGSTVDVQAPTVALNGSISNGDFLIGPAGSAAGIVTISIQGVASDEVGGSGVTGVEVQTRSLDNALWYNPISGVYSGAWEGPDIPVVLTRQGVSETWDWTTSMDLPMGSYRVFVRAMDLAGNVTPVRDRVRFSAIDFWNPPPPPTN